MNHNRGVRYVGTKATDSKIVRQQSTLFPSNGLSRSVCMMLAFGIMHYVLRIGDHFGIMEPSV